jgi:hypothetical protein
MTGARWLETDSLSNQNISSALEIGSYTADADRLIAVQWFADAVAGGGDYVFYATLQVNGSGSAYRLLPQTTGTAAAALTAIGAQSGLIAVRSGDVVKVWLDGLAGDTTTPDTVVRWSEVSALQPATAERTLDVNANGAAKADLVSILGTVLTETSGYLAAAFKKFFNIATPVATVASVDQTGDAYAIVNHADYGNEKLAKPGDPMTIARR